jgi:Mg2+/Co2+ transporter CorC
VKLLFVIHPRVPGVKMLLNKDLLILIHQRNQRFKKDRLLKPALKAPPQKLIVLVHISERGCW